MNRVESIKTFFLENFWKLVKYFLKGPTFGGTKRLKFFGKKSKNW